MTSLRLVGALEIGGTHVTAAVLAVGQRTIQPASLRATTSSPPSGTRDELVRAIVSAAQRLAVPGRDSLGRRDARPIRLRARHLADPRRREARRALRRRPSSASSASALGLRPQDVVFLNDANAFLIGEWWAGAAQGHERAMGVTLGTGLGSAFLERGQIVESDPRVPPEGRLDLVPFRGAPVEETLSRRGLRSAYGEATCQTWWRSRGERATASAARPRCFAASAPRSASSSRHGSSASPRRALSSAAPSRVRGICGRTTSAPRARPRRA